MLVVVVGSSPKASARVVRVVLSTPVPVVVSASVVAVAVVVCASVVVAGATVVSITVVTGASAGRGINHTAPTAAHNTNTATVADSHRLSAYRGVGTTRFWFSEVIQAGQKRALSRRLAPQCGQTFIYDYPSVSK